VARKDSDPPSGTVAAEGTMATDGEDEVTGGGSMVTAADALAVGSATLVATTW
jgi:hypothetical protein